MLPESPSVAPGWLLPLNEISRLPMLCGSRPPPSWSLRPSVFFLLYLLQQIQPSYVIRRPTSAITASFFYLLFDLDLLTFYFFFRLFSSALFLPYVSSTFSSIHFFLSSLSIISCPAGWGRGAATVVDPLAGATDLTGDDQGHRPMRGHPSSCPCRPWPPPIPPASGWAVSRLKKVPPQVSAFVNPFSSS